MKKVLCILILLVLLLTSLAAPALAQSNFYIIPDSDRRYLTEAELWGWQYEAVGYIYNEIFARHGRAFRTGEKYDLYFRNQAWYQVNPKYSYNMLNYIEAANEQLAHQVLKDMRAQKTTNPNGKPLPTGSDAPIGFSAYGLSPNQKLPVYTGPGSGYYRAANGKASVSTNGTVWIAGEENGWLLIQYEVNSGRNRIGYIQKSKLTDRLSVPTLDFSYASATVTTNPCYLWDEMSVAGDPLTLLANGTAVTALDYFGSNQYWCYVEVTTAQGTMRGFVVSDCLTVIGGMAEG